MKVPKISQQNKMLLLSFFVLILCYILFSPQKSEPKNSSQKIYADTLIPAGFVLVPVELGNADSVSALMDQYGIVDLYTGNQIHQGTKRIASRVKLLRAPLNPQQFAVLVPERLSNLIMSTPGPFWAIVQNRAVEQGTNVVNEKRTVRIEYHQGGG